MDSPLDPILDDNKAVRRTARRILLGVGAAAISVGAVAAVALAAEGDFDPAFNGGQPVFVSAGPAGSVTKLSAVTKQADGKIVIAGSTDSGSGIGLGTWVIERFLTNGQPDPAFGSQGVVKLDMGSLSGATGVAVQPSDQKIVVGGTAEVAGGFDVGFARLNTDGSPDMSFGGGTSKVVLSRTNEAVTNTGTLVLGADGTLFLAGTAQDSSTSTTHSTGVIASVSAAGALNGWDPSGILVPNTGPAGSKTGISSVAVAGANVFYVGSSFDSSSAQHSLIGAVSASTGAADASFGSGGLFIPFGASTALNAVIVAADGKLKVTGFGTGTGPGTGALIASFNTSGADPTDTGFGSGGKVVVGGAANTPNNGNAITEIGSELFAATTAVLSGGNTQPAVLAVNESTGALDTGLGPSGFRLYNLGAIAYATGIVDPKGKRGVVVGERRGAKNDNDEGYVAAFQPTSSTLIAKPDFRLRIPFAADVTANRQAGELPRGKLPLYGPVTFDFTVTNDGRAEGTARVEFSYDNVKGTRSLLRADSVPGVEIFGDRPGELRAPRSLNCETTFVLKPGQTEKGECWMVGPRPFALGNNVIKGLVVPTDSPTDPDRDNDTTTDNNASKDIQVLPAPAAVIDKVPSGLGTVLDGHTTLQVMARDTSAGAAATKHPAAIRRVLVALVRVPSGAHAARARASCLWLGSANGTAVRRPTKHGVCTGAVFLVARGAAHWRFKLKHRLICGSFVAYATAIDNAGFRETTFSARLGNRRAFRI